VNRTQPYYLVVYYAPVEQSQVPIGILLFDPQRDSLILRFRRDWSFAEEDDREILVGLSASIAKMARELGPAALINFFEDTLSNTISISERRYLGRNSDLPNTLNTIFEREIPGA
jgi:hypothetical protein